MVRQRQDLFLQGLEILAVRPSAAPPRQGHLPQAPLQLGRHPGQHRCRVTVH
ncbi:hypothetical protein O3G_MSEX000280 [Manduca sexta]|nr:hypothetical protein O3G_MSEX000280 [Manduca sexta]